MNYKIEVSEDFKEELEDICRYLDFITKSDELADKLILLVYKNIKRLSNSPEICSRMNITDENGNELRRMIIGKYLIIYYIIYRERVVYISHIIDGRSNYLNKMKFNLV